MVLKRKKKQEEFENRDVEDLFDDEVEEVEEAEEIIEKPKPKPSPQKQLSKEELLDIIEGHLIRAYRLTEYLKNNY